MPRQSPSETVYSSVSQVGKPHLLLRALWHDLRAARELAWRLMVRDVSVQYRQSLLGVAWAFIPPIVLAAGFTLATRARVIDVGETELPYPAYVMLGTSLWQTFMEALNGPLQGLTRARLLLLRIRFPPEAIVLAKLGEALLNFAIKLLLIGGLFLWYGIPVGWPTLLAPLALGVLLLLGTLIGMLLAPLGLLYQDVTRGVVLAAGFWFLLTPVVYPVPTAGRFATLVALNPVTPVLVTARELATGGTLTLFPAFLVVTGLTLIGFVATWILLRLALPHVVERLGS